MLTLLKATNAAAVASCASTQVKLVTPKGWQKYFEVPKLQKKERKTWLKTYAQNQVDKTPMKFNVTYYTADAIMIALTVKDMWEGLDYVEL